MLSGVFSADFRNHLSGVNCCGKHILTKTSTGFISSCGSIGCESFKIQAEITYSWKIWYLSKRPKKSLLIVYLQESHLQIVYEQLEVAVYADG